MVMLSLLLLGPSLAGTVKRECDTDHATKTSAAYEFGTAHPMAGPTDEQRGKKPLSDDATDEERAQYNTSPNEPNEGHEAYPSTTKTCFQAEGNVLSVELCAAARAAGGKPNEDSYVAACAESGSTCAFLVFDGHGAKSHLDSHKAAELFVNAMKTSPPPDSFATSTSTYTASEEAIKKVTYVVDFELGVPGGDLRKVEANSDLADKQFAISEGPLAQWFEEKIAAPMREFGSRDEWDDKRLRFPASYHSGCTATGLFVNLDTGAIKTVNVGDSRTLVIPTPAASGKELISTVDHTPDEESEEMRIRSAGGFVSKDSGVPRVNGISMVSRSLGDVWGKMHKNETAVKRRLEALCADEQYTCDHYARIGTVPYNVAHLQTKKRKWFRENGGADMQWRTAKNAIDFEKARRIEEENWMEGDRRNMVVTDLPDFLEVSESASNAQEVVFIIGSDGVYDSQPDPETKGAEGTKHIQARLDEHGDERVNRALVSATVGVQTAPVADLQATLITTVEHVVQSGYSSRMATVGRSDDTTAIVGRITRTARGGSALSTTEGVTDE